MPDEPYHVDQDLHERLVAATKEGSGTATWSILKALDTNKPSANPGTQLKQSNTKSDTSNGYAGVDRDDDKLSTTAHPPVHARLTEATDPHPKNGHPASYDGAPQQPVPQHPAAQLSAPQYPAIQYPTHSIWQTPSQPHQNQSSTSQPRSSEPIQDAQQQYQLRRILSCHKDAYFDILSLANGTDMPVVIKTSWHNLSYLVNPVGCRLPDADLAFSRVNDAYAWIQAHPGLPQPTPSTPRASLAASSPGANTVRESQQSWDSPGTRPHIAPQQPESGPTRRFGSPPPGRSSPMPSSHIYVNNGKPTLRPAVGWQFREIGGETRVWCNGQWRSLIQNSPEFRGLRVNKDGWIMPKFDRHLRRNQWRKVREQAKVEFNSHT